MTADGRRPSTRRRAVLGALSTAVCGLGGCTDAVRRLAGPSRRLRFGDDVPAQVRARAERALDRVEKMLDEELVEPVHVRFGPPRERDAARSMTRFGRVTARAVHREPAPRSVPFPLGTHHGGEESTITLTDPSELDVEELARAVGGGDEVRELLEAYPPESHIAHELAHAFQRQLVDRVPATGPHDVERARQSIREGAAQYVESRYRASCASGVYDPCHAPATESPVVELAPNWALPTVIPYVNGAVLTAWLYRRGSWDAVWNSHESPPTTAWAAMFPGRYVTDGIDTVAVDPADPPDGWLALDPGRNYGTYPDSHEGRMGVNALYEKLANLDLVADDADAAVDPRVGQAMAVDRCFRTDLLADWRGDRLRGYAHVDDYDRLGYRWQVAFASETAARALARATATAYDRRGSRRDAGWRLNGRLVDVHRDGNRITFLMAPDPAGIDALRPGGSS